MTSATGGTSLSVCQKNCQTFDMYSCKNGKCVSDFTGEWSSKRACDASPRGKTPPPPHPAPHPSPHPAPHPSPPPTSSGHNLTILWVLIGVIVAVLIGIGVVIYIN